MKLTEWETERQREGDGEYSRKSRISKNLLLCMMSYETWEGMKARKGRRREGEGREENDRNMTEHGP